MTNRRTTMLWMKDLIEHMNRCHEQLQWADSRTQSFLTESLLTDLSEFQRLCEELRATFPAAGASASSSLKVKDRPLLATA